MSLKRELWYGLAVLTSVLGNAFAGIALLAPHMGLTIPDAHWYWPFVGLLVGYLGTYSLGVLVATVVKENE